MHVAQGRKRVIPTVTVPCKAWILKGDFPGTTAFKGYGVKQYQYANERQTSFCSFYVIKKLLREIEASPCESQK